MNIQKTVMMLIVILIVTIIISIIYLSLFFIDVDTNALITCMNLDNSTLHPRLITYSGCHAIFLLNDNNSCHESGTFCILRNGTEVKI